MAVERGSPDHHGPVAGRDRSSPRAPRDRDRQATYDAEAAAFDGSAYEEPIGLYHCTRLTGAVADTRWWSTHVRREPPRLRDARADARRSSARRATWEVRFAHGHDSVVTLAHELAHLATPGGDGHDDHFRRTQVDVLGLLAGPRVAARLHAAFGRAGLGVAAPTDPPPDDLGRGGLVGRFGDVLRRVDDDHRRHVDRIRKLLAKAASTTAEEADALTAKALDLSVRHGIHRALLAAPPDGDGIRERMLLLGSGPYVGARWYLLARVADHLGCETFYRAGDTGRLVTVVGFPGDVDRALDLFRALDHQAALGALAVSSRGSTTRARREFLYGFAHGVDAQLADAAVRAGVEDTTNPAAVVLVERRAAVADHVARTYRLRSERRGRVEPSAAFGAGAAAGADAAVPRPRLGPAPRALAAPP